MSGGLFIQSLSSCKDCLFENCKINCSNNGVFFAITDPDVGSFRIINCNINLDIDFLIYVPISNSNVFPFPLEFSNNTVICTNTTSTIITVGLSINQSIIKFNNNTITGIVQNVFDFRSCPVEFNNNFIDVSSTTPCILFTYSGNNSVILTHNYFSITTNISGSYVLLLDKSLGVGPVVKINSINNTYTCTSADAVVSIGEFIDFYTVNDIYKSIAGTVSIAGTTQPTSSLVNYNNITRVNTTPITYSTSITTPATALPQPGYP